MPQATGRYDDAILRLATVLLRIVIVLIWVSLALVLLAIPIAFVRHDGLVAMLARGGYAADVVPALVGVAAGAAAILFLAARFFGQLLRLMRTVEEGDPFVPENAERLRTMAWLLLAIEVLGLVTGMIAHAAVGKSAGFEFSVTGLIAVLSLFVLARVFARGTAMRDDIEGTV